MNLNSRKTQNIIIVFLVVLTISIFIVGFVKTKAATITNNDLQLKPPILSEEKELAFDETDEEESPITIIGNDISILLDEEFSIDMLNISVIDIKDGELTYEIISNNIDTSVVGTYEIIIEATNSDSITLSKTFIVTVSEEANTAPKVQGDNITLELNSFFGISKLNISAIDTEDGRLPYKVISNNVDTSKAGIYEVIISATDSQGLSSTVTFIVTVKKSDSEDTDKPEETKNTKPTISGNNITLNIGDSFNISDLKITAVDKEDGPIKYSVVSNNVDTSKAGTYKVVVKATDSKGLSVTATFTVSIKKPTTEESENTKPTISGNNITLNIGDSFSISDLGITAVDKEDGPIKYSVVSNNVDTSKAGTYKVVVKATDSKDLSVTATFTVTVNEVAPPKPENTKPTISGSSITVNVGDSFDISDLGITAFDKEDGTLPYEIVSNNVDTSTAGSYNVVVSARDSEGLSTTATFTVTVVETTP